MAADIRELIEKAVDALKKNPDLVKSFQSDPVKAIEKLLGVDLPDEAIQAVIKGVKAKLDADKVGDALGKLSGLFGK